MPSRITISDPQKFPVQAFFNAVADSSFVAMVDHLTRGIGYASNEADCSFPSDLDPGEDVFAGVRFSLFEDWVILDKEQLLAVMKEAATAYISEYPSGRQVLEQYLSRDIPMLS